MEAVDRVVVGRPGAPAVEGPRDRSGELWDLTLDGNYGTHRHTGHPLESVRNEPHQLAHGAQESAETLHRGSVTERVGLGGCCTDFAIDVVTSRDSDLSAGAPRYDPHGRVLYGREGHDLGHDDELPLHGLNDSDQVACLERNF